MLMKNICCECLQYSHQGIHHEYQMRWQSIQSLGQNGTNVSLYLSSSPRVCVCFIISVMPSFTPLLLLIDCPELPVKRSNVP